MRKKLVFFVIGFFFLFLSQAHAKQTTINFDDLTGSGSLPANYAGLTWDSSWLYFNNPSPPYTPSSGTCRIFTYNSSAWINFGRKVNFYGSWVSNALAYSHVYWEGYRDGVKVYESEHLYGPADGWIYVNWEDVDYVKIVTSYPGYFIIDDVMYSVPDKTTINFDDLTGSGSLPANYAGLTWDSSWLYFNNPSPPYTPSSGTCRIFTYNSSAWINFGRKVNFYGSWVSNALAYSHVYWEGYRDGVKVYESEHLYGPADGWIYVNWEDVDYVKIVTSYPGYFIIDDIMYE
jgi:hypothetical protein